MNNKLWLIPVMLILLAVGVSGALENATSFCPFNQNVSDVSGNGNHGTIVDNTSITGISHVGNGSASFDGNNDQITYGNTMFQYDDGCIMMWFNDTSDDKGFLYNGGWRVKLGIGTLEGCGSGTQAQLGELGFWTFDTGWRCAASTGTNVNDSAWHLATATWDGTNNHLYLDGALVDSIAAAQPTWQVGKLSVLGTDSVGADDYFGLIDNFWITNANCSQQNVTDAWNGGAGCDPYGAGCAGGGGGGGADTINISTALPSATFQSNITTWAFNLTGNFSNTTTTCGLYFNSTINETKSYSNGTDVAINYSKTFSTGSYTYDIRCNDSLTNWENSTGVTFYIDPVVPVITTNFTNLTFFYRSNLTGQFNFTDNFMLYSYNISIDGTSISSLIDLNTTIYQYNLSYNASSLSVGTHTLTARVSDGHTAKELGGDYEVSNGLFNDYLEFEFYDGGYAKITTIDGSILDTFAAKKELDRYTFTYEPSDIKKLNYSFEVEASNSIDIVEKKGHYGDRWLIIDGRKWLDFVLDNEPNALVSITQITDKKVNVTITGLQYKDLLQFSSIGDLNIVTQNYTFYTTNATVTYSSPVLERQEQNIYLAINKTGSILSTAANLTWNGTNQAVTKTAYSHYDYYTSTFTVPTVSASVNVSFTWNYNITGTYNNETGNLTNNQTIVKIGIDNCSTYSMRAVNISIYNETSDALVNSNLDAYFEVWISDANNYSQFNLTWDNVNTTGICISPNWSTYNIYGQMEFVDTAGAFATKTYYFVNTSFSNSTQILDLYLTDGTSIVTFNVRDENDDPVSEAYIQVLSYDLGTHSYKVTEILKTDSEGQALGQMVLNTQWYQFIITYEDEIVLTTDPTKLTLTTYTFRINLDSDAYSHFNTYRGVTSSLTFTNATRTFRYTFSDSSNAVQQGCLRVIRRTINGDTEINNSCTTSAAATILVTIPVNPDGTYIASGYVDINPTFITDILSVVFGGNWETFGLSGVFVSFMLTVTMVAVGLWSPIVAVILMTLGVVLAVILDFFYLSIPMLLGFIIVAGITIYRLRR